MFLEPCAQWDIGIGRVVSAVGGCCSAEDLASYWIDFGVKVGDCHFVLGTQPAVTVSIPDYFAGEVGGVCTTGVPGAAVEQERRPGRDTQRDAAFRAGRAILRDFDLIPQLSARYEQGVAASGLADVSQVVSDFQGETGSWIRFNLIVDAHAVLMPGNGPVLSCRIFTRSDV